MIASLSDIRKNPHCMQSIRQGGFYDLLVEKEGKSEHRHCYTDLDFSMEFDLDEENIPYNEYVDLKPLDATVLHWGQLKLLLGEIEFLTPYMGVEDLCVVYMGSAPGHHIKVLVDMMPKTWKWELYDDKPCEVFCDDRVEDIILEKISAQPSRFRASASTDPHCVQCRSKLIDPPFFRTLQPTAQTLPYYSRVEEDKTVLHWGQRKLLLSEVEFLTICHKDYDLVNNQHTVVYAGAAPGNHITALATMFPSLRFVLIDPRQSVVKPSERIEIIQDLFTDEMALELAKRKEILFISDVRTADPSVDNTDESDEKIKEDMDAQRRWHAMLGSKRSIMKFRLPWDEKSSEYLDGDIHLPVWGLPATTECRLITNKTDPSATRMYDHEKHESQMFYFNTVTRPSLYSHKVKAKGIDRCYDCRSEIEILSSYLTEIKKIDQSVCDAEVGKLSEWISLQLSTTRTLSDPTPEKHFRLPTRKIEINDFPELQELLENKDFATAYDKYKHTHHKEISTAMLNAKKQELDRKAKNQSDIVDQLRTMSVPRMSMHTNTQLLYRLQHTIPIAREHRPNVRTHLKYVTIAEAKELRAKYVSRPQTEGDPQLLCISDIRTPLERITETSVQFDMVMQKGLLEALGPYQASLKFKLPYSDKFPRLNYYLDGKLLYQPYSPRVSHECRLHTGKGVALSSTTQYDNDDYAKKLFHFQSTLRTSLYNTDDTLPNEADHPNLVSNGVGTDHCFDCTAARYIIRKYIEARCLEGTDVLKTLDDIVKQLITIQVACKADGNGTLDE